MKQHRSCSDCIHVSACDAWNVGTLFEANADNCFNYETVRESNVYFLGYRDGINAAMKKIDDAETDTALDS